MDSIFAFYIRVCLGLFLGTFLVVDAIIGGPLWHLVYSLGRNISDALR